MGIARDNALGLLRATNDAQRTGLILAAEAGHFQAVRLLIHEGADIHAKDFRGDTALMRASVWGHLDVCEYILSISPKAILDRNNVGGTPLHKCSRWGHPQVAKLLLDAGADPDVFNTEGDSPATLARDYGNDKISRLFIQANAGPKP